MMIILIVDDSKVARMAVARHISMLGEDHEIWESHDVPSGLEKVSEAIPDKAIVDLNMPGPDGLTLVAALIENGMSPSNIAVLTANIQGAVKNRVQDLGAQFLAKPTSAEQIAGFINSSNEND
ncbi:MAG: response regulator [Sphingomonadales bacterium]|nr:response regulator [Sphingomonadales bacterium]